MSFGLINKYFSPGGLLISFWLIACFLILFITLRQNYVLFHTVVEFTVTLIGFSIFIIAANTYRYSKNGFYLYIGLVFFIYSLFNFFHTIAYEGVEIVSNRPNAPTQIWIVQRFFLAVTIFPSAVLLSRKYNYCSFLASLTFFIIYFFYTLTAILYWKNFPDAFVSGVGLTNYKIISEYIISSLFFLGIIWFSFLRDRIDHVTNFYILSFLLFSLFAELAFSMYTDVYGALNMLGHFFIFVSVLFLNSAFLRKTLNDPYSLLFKELTLANKKLSKLAVTDSLTDILNRRAVMDKIIEEFNVRKRYGGSFSIIMIDLDKFKEINDTYGHSAGDSVLIEFAKILKASTRENDIVGRHGGDEFIICPLEASGSECERIINNIRIQTNAISIAPNIKKGYLNFSAGYHSMIPNKNMNMSPEIIVGYADSKMFEDKLRNKRLPTKH